MSWITIIWSAIVTVCLTLAAVHALVWFQNRSAWGNLVFTATALSTAVIALFEFAAMRASAPEHYSAIIRWVHVPAFVLMAALVAFVHRYLGAGRLWLGWTVLGVRALSLGLNFLTGENLNFTRLTSTPVIPFLGESVHVPAGDPNPWMFTASLSLLLLGAFLADAAVTVWRRGDRRRALSLGGSMVALVLLPGVNAVLLVQGVYHLPFLVAPFYLPFLGAMSFELSRDLARSAELTRRLQVSEAALRESELRTRQAAQAAQMAIWSWDIAQDVIWVSGEGRGLHGITNHGPVNFERFLATVHPQDRARTQAAVEECLARRGEFRAEYRVLTSAGHERWIAAMGRLDVTPAGLPGQLRGVSLDITERRQMEFEVLQQRNQLAHLTRVNLLGELSGSLAHELNQPLTAILSNAQAAQRYLAQPAPDLGEIREILKDIVAEDQRAGEVIRRLRLLLRKGEVQFQPLSLNDVVLEVLRLARSDLVSHEVTAHTVLAAELPFIHGDSVQLQQVLLNLVVNACDSMNGQPPDERQLTIGTRLSPDGGAVELSVADQGAGVSPDQLERLFEPFFTTKSHGMGLGLSVCRTIVTAHHGRIWAVNNAGPGATFCFTVPVTHSQPA